MTVPPTTAEKLNIQPMERSMSRMTMTKTMPMASMPGEGRAREQLAQGAGGQEVGVGHADDDHQDEQRQDDARLLRHARPPRASGRTVRCGRRRVDGRHGLGTRAMISDRLSLLDVCGGRLGPARWLGREHGPGRPAGGEIVECFVGLLEGRAPCQDRVQAGCAVPDAGVTLRRAAPSPASTCSIHQEPAGDVERRSGDVRGVV